MENKEQQTEGLQVNEKLKFRLPSALIVGGILLALAGFAAFNDKNAALIFAFGAAFVFMVGGLIGEWQEHRAVSKKAGQ